MEPEYIAVTVTVSVLGGIIVIALVVVCVVKVVSDINFEKSMARQQEYENSVALQEVHEHPSYIHYPEPEPYTPTHAPEVNPWRTSHIEPSVHNQNPSHDPQDHATPGYNPSRRPSIHQPYLGPANGAPNMARRSSYAQDMPRRGSYAQGLQRRQSHVEGMPRRASRAGNIQRNISRRPSMAQNRRSSVANEPPKLPTRRGSLQPDAEGPGGDKKKLWYFYLNEDPDYFSRDSKERKKMQAKAWSSENRDMPNSSEPANRPIRRDSYAPPQPHVQPHPRPQPYPYAQPQPYPPSQDPRTQWM